MTPSQIGPRSLEHHKGAASMAVFAQSGVHTEWISGASECGAAGILRRWFST